MTAESATSPLGRKRRRFSSALSITSAFFRMDFVQQLSYPLTFGLGQLNTLVPVVISFFIGELVGDSASVGGDYLTFAVIGIAVGRLLGIPLRAFGVHLQRAQNRGTFETLLVEPVPWLALPIVMSSWQFTLGIISAGLTLAFGWLLGAQYSLDGVPESAVILFLGLLASAGIGLVSASLMVLAKKSSQFIRLYLVAANVLAGAVFPTTLLPAWLRPLSLAIPHTYAINSVRGLLMDPPPDGAISFSTAAIALSVFIVVVLPFGFWLLSRSMQYARKMGMLSGY